MNQRLITRLSRADLHLNGVGMAHTQTHRHQHTSAPKRAFWPSIWMFEGTLIRIENDMERKKKKKKNDKEIGHLFLLGQIF